MTNNDILKKLRVALQLRDEQIVEILELVDFRISKGELGNFFRNVDHPKYMECGDQILRNFLNGLVIYLRGTKEEPKNPMEVLQKNKENIVKKVKTDRPAEPKAFGSKPKAAGPAGKKPFAKSDKPKNPLGNIKFNNGKKK
ncbi:DUF1456 family protein [Myroides odoratus]|uniref:DUF1456 family protein n=1 Tax=Myroides odoratus TaxID=256 RepID=A0A9Q6ZER6_MYROD|nr:DUF1456 family protein [Myroides odoratus]EHQ44077.1 protein of unknown function DUF1456 [Myroides odoratus DSM 2801]EKB05275.1 hypothetical protein HMPREF9716_02829 [Myroides odoratus CIP 103059]QQU01371.1 DUF1456 family protein [Myroides odoratus]WQD56364.1 DUF1456 family protein [Myroides odoratus]STZ31366.1 Protein of uncharacterised function (DUF1456) [Myroides odoratus]